MNKQIWTTDSQTGRWVLTRERIDFMVSSLALSGSNRHAIRLVLIPLCRKQDVDPALDVYFFASGRLRPQYREQLSRSTKPAFQSLFPPKKRNPAPQDA